MKNANPAVIALLNARPVSYYSCDLYAIATVGGPTVYLTTADFDVIGPAPSAFATPIPSDFSSDMSSDFGRLSGSTVYSCGSINSGNPKIDLKQSRVQGHAKRGLDSDSWTVAIVPTTMDPWSGAMTYPDVVGGTPWLAACRAGLFDGAAVQVARAYFAAPPTPPYTAASRTCLGTILVFSGIVGPVTTDQTVSVFNINDYKYLLNTLMPRNLVQASCPHTLFDTRCTLNAASYAATAAALAGSSRQLVLASPAAPTGSGSYQLGRMVGVTGANATYQRVVSAWDGVKSFTPQIPWPFAPGVGDQFTFYPGCDKSNGAGGCAGFSNLVNFRGMPYVPVPEISIG